MDPYYQDERVQLFHGDCVELMADLPDQSVDAVLTDPPYSSGGRRENARAIRGSMLRSMADSEWIHGDAMSTGGFVYLMRLCALRWRRLLVPGGHVLSFIDWRMCDALGAAMETADLRRHPTLVWDKGRLGMGAVFRNQHEFIVHASNGTPSEPRRRDTPNVLRFPPVGDGDHPTEKPTALLQRLLSVVCGPDGLVLDPFAGSGSTLTAAVMTGNRAIGIDSDERWCEVAAKRLSQGVLDFEGTA
jgi:site-specific DNA-methyltransferase (adenine-specific)